MIKECYQEYLRELFWDPLCFLLYINDIDTDICSSICLFADDCMLYRIIETPEDHQQLQCKTKTPRVQKRQCQSETAVIIIASYIAIYVTKNIDIRLSPRIS